MLFDLPFRLATMIVRAFIERQAGPETAESRELSRDMDQVRLEIDRLEAQLAYLERRRLAVRTQARAMRDTWWMRNREAVAVNIVGGLIYSIPLLAIGIFIGQLID